MHQNEKWVIISHPGDYTGIGKRCGISPVLARILRNRGIESEKDIRDFLNAGEDSLNSPEYSAFNLFDMDKAVSITLRKIEEKKKIRIVGDYDIDGVSAAFILLKGLRKAGADADCRIPHRIRDGYGLNINIINEAIEDKVDTLITCDNGIAARDEVLLAKEHGITVIITDHHEVPFHMEGEIRKEDLPKADAIVDPKRDDCPYPFKMICGAYVAFKFILALYEKAGIERKEADEFLSIAAFATIGDVMPLIGENRSLMKTGLRKLKFTENPGLRALISLNQLDGAFLTPYHVGFILGPCINAAGRLGDAADSLDLLLCQDKEEAHEKAVILKELNDSRKNLTEKGVEEALGIALSPEYEKDRVYVIYLPDCHESIAGIVAGKVRESTGHPAFILTDANTLEGKPCLKGSGRSIDGYHMFEELTKAGDLLIRFGGHALAAGLSLEKEKLGELRQRLNENSALTEDDLKVKVRIDMELPLSLISESLIEELRTLEPFGTGNDRPLFAARDVFLKNMRVFGKNSNVLKGAAVNGKTTLDFVYFGADAMEMKSYIEKCPGSLKIIYSPEIDDYNGTRSIQLNIKGIR